jgi:YidC/Oxa1 family membrane protein insertase
LPLVTIALFIIQQKMFLPPPTDEQAALQQKMMQYMMVFMGVMFFKVASGLCLYFIASSLWGIAERKLLPKPAPKGGAAAGGEAAARLPSPPGANGSGKGNRKTKQRHRK